MSISQKYSETLILWFAPQELLHLEGLWSSLENKLNSIYTKFQCGYQGQNKLWTQNIFPCARDALLIGKEWLKYVLFLWTQVTNQLWQVVFVNSNLVSLLSSDFKKNKKI